MPRLPADAFERFVALGPTRSYSRLATALGVSKRSIVARASKEGWQDRLRGIETEARQRHHAQAVEDQQAINERHLKTARAVLARGLEALRSMPLPSAVAAVRAIDTAVKIERAVLGVDKQPEGRGLQWSDIVDSVSRAAAETRARAREAAEAAPPPPDPLPASVASRLYLEN